MKAPIIGLNIVVSLLIAALNPVWLVWIWVVAQFVNGACWFSKTLPIASQKSETMISYWSSWMVWTALGVICIVLSLFGLWMTSLVMNLLFMAIAHFVGWIVLQALIRQRR